MPTYIALLRGINVGGDSRRVAMADLRAVVSSLGHTDVATYIQSGNVLFSSAEAEAEADAASLAAALELAIDEQLGVPARVVVLSRDDLAEAVRRNPYRDEPNPKLVHVLFLNDDPGPGLLRDVAAATAQAAEQGSRDTARVAGCALYLHTPDGFGRSKLALRLTQLRGEKAGPAATARNWRTVTKLLALCGPAVPSPGTSGSWRV